MKTELERLHAKLATVQKQLAKVRGKEYDLPFGSSARAKVSRKWDELSKEKWRLLTEIENHETKQEAN